jgi:hypothetical protein
MPHRIQRALVYENEIATTTTKKPRWRPEAGEPGVGSVAELMDPKTTMPRMTPRMMVTVSCEL